MASINRENVQILGFVSVFLWAVEKYTSNMDDILQSCDN